MKLLTSRQARNIANKAELDSLLKQIRFSASEGNMYHILYDEPSIKIARTLRRLGYKIEYKTWTRRIRFSSHEYTEFRIVWE